MTTKRIPIRNIYYLLCYAWGQLNEGSVVDVSRLPSTNLADLFATVLIGGVRHVMRRGLDRSYVGQIEAIAGVRGRVDFSASARRMHLQHGRAVCEFDELQVDTLPNQILKATLSYLAAVPELDKDLRHTLLQQRRDFRDVTDVRLNGSLFRQVQLHSNNRYYRFLLNVCELVHGAWLVDEASGNHKFRDFLDDDRRMAKVFQKFVLNFYKSERPELNAKAEDIKWRVEASDASSLAYLPRMTTDISIKRGNKKLIIDTKYYRETFSAYFNSVSIHSNNLYQMLAYLSNVKREEGESVSGMLLYPSVDRDVDVRFDSLQGFPMRICTVNLARDWQDIRKELLSLVSGL
jgi:5-methylcytosine-specific restriction enzyme subunit McrC